MRGAYSWWSGVEAHPAVFWKEARSRAQIIGNRTSGVRSRTSNCTFASVGITMFASSEQQQQGRAALSSFV